MVPKSRGVVILWCYNVRSGNILLCQEVQVVRRLVSIGHCPIIVCHIVECQVVGEPWMLLVQCLLLVQWM